MPLDDSQVKPFVWYNYSHKEAKVFNPSTQLGSLSKSRYLPVKFTNSEARDVLSFDHLTGKASVKLSITLDDQPTRKIEKTLPFDLEGSTVDFSSLFTPVKSNDSSTYYSQDCSAVIATFLADLSGLPFTVNDVNPKLAVVDFLNSNGVCFSQNQA